MPSDPLILAIDNGTQSVRALLFDTRGNLVAKGRQEIQPYPHWLASTMAFAQRSLMQQMALWSSSVKQPSWTALFLTSLTPYWLV